MLLRVFVLVLLCVALFGPLASAGNVTATPVDDVEDTQLQQLEAQTGQDVQDIEGGLSKAWGIVGVVLVAIIVVSVIV